MSMYLSRLVIPLTRSLFLPIPSPFHTFLCLFANLSFILVLTLLLSICYSLALLSLSLFLTRCLPHSRVVSLTHFLVLLFMRWLSLSLSLPRSDSHCCLFLALSSLLSLSPSLICCISLRHPLYLSHSCLSLSLVRSDLSL